MHSPLAPNCKPVHGGVWSKGHQLSPTSPHLWLKFVDDTFVIQQAKHSQQPLHNINSQDPHMQFTRGTQPRRSLTVPGYFGFSRSQQHSSHHSVQKPTHTNQYLHWDSSHFITAKNSVFNTLAFMAKVVCSNQHTLQQEMDHMGKALLTCNFPPEALNSLHTKFNHNTQQWLWTSKPTPTTKDLTTITSPLWSLHKRTRRKVQGDLQ